MSHTVFVGLSGGVDSAVSAALLQESGFSVVGAFIKIWQPEFIECTWKEDRLDAMRVAAALGIPFEEIDLSEEYQKNVVQDMVADYAHGVTPNPDILCNRYIKFGAFARWAKSKGAHSIATGHYARIEQEGAHYKLLRGVDPAKDQSYFLYTLGQPDLAHAIFPVGGLSKTQVRKAAKRFSLPVAQKPDSQGLCFVGEVSMADFLARFIPVVEGPVVDVQGTRIGSHEGATLYTIGQRHGFEINGASAQRGPFYIVDIDVSSNTIRVSPQRIDAGKKSVRLVDAHWISRLPSLPLSLHAQARYHEQPVSVTLDRQEKELVANFLEPHIVSPGQSLVLYDGDVCVGGAIITK
jgi:tRNA-specific 2-thiouridylase